VKYALVDHVGVVYGLTSKAKLKAKRRMMLIPLNEDQESDVRSRPTFSSYQGGRYVTIEREGRWVYRWESQTFEFLSVKEIQRLKDEDAQKQVDRFAGFEESLNETALDEVEDLFE
jgi:predicted MPP superfamily phosphohydrolase